MVNSLPITIAIGMIVGFLSGLGIGGGSLLMLWLTLMAGMAHDTARLINLMFFIPSALSASLLRLFRKDRPDWKSVVPAALTGCLAAVLCSGLRQRIDTALLQKAFGLLLIAAGTREITWKDKKK